MRKIWFMKVNLALEVPDEIALELPRGEHDLGDILVLGLREWKRQGTGEFGGLAALLEKLAELPSAEEVIALHPAPEMQLRVSQLLDKNRAGGLTPDEARELQQHEFIEHLMRLAKGRALAKLKAA